MNDALGKVYYDVLKYPRGLCEQGCGSQMTIRNRFIVGPHIVEAHLQNQIGRGMNLVGYYMYHGGTQLPGLKEPGYPESYGFQAPIGEFGNLRPSYKYLKILHNFVRDFGSDLANMQVVEPENPVRDQFDTENLRFVVRAKDDAGFLFFKNAKVRVTMPDKTFKINLHLDNEMLEIPRQTMTLKGEKTAILPFNLDVNSALLKYATAQPLCRFTKGDKQYLFFTEIEGKTVELAFFRSTIRSVSAQGWDKSESGDMIYLMPKTGGVIETTANNGKKAVIVLLSPKQAENCWRAKIIGQESIILTNADLLQWNNKIELRQLDDNEFDLQIFPPVNKLPIVGGKALTPQKEGLFARYSFSVPLVDTEINISGLPAKDLSVLIPSNLNDVFLEINYRGGSAVAESNGRTLTDRLFNSQPWLFGLKRFIPSQKRQSIEFNVFPWSDNITGIKKELVDRVKKSNPLIVAAQVRPQYKTIITFQ